MKWALLILGAAGAIGSAGCCWRQPQPYGYPAQSYAPAFAPQYQPMQAAPCMPVQQAPACSCY